MNSALKKPWDDIIPLSEQEIYARAGFGKPVGLGQRPALLVIDVQYRTVGEQPDLPIEKAILQYPTSCGEIGWRAVREIEKLVRWFRAANLPIIYPHVAVKAAHDRGQFADKVPGVMSIPIHGYEFVREVAPVAGDICIAKSHASAFFGTALASSLVSSRVDSLIFTGCTTSGCVRASVVDACSLNYKCVVPQDAVFDRSAVSHAVNLFDMASKYADVMPTSSVITTLDLMLPHANSSKAVVG